MQVEWQEPAWRWFEDLVDGAQRRVAEIADQLEMMGRGLLGTKYAKKLTNHSFLHELVIDFKGAPFCPLFSFESNGNERAVILVAGDKRGDDRYYDRMMPRAEKTLDEYRRDT